MPKTIEELERELEKERNDTSAFRSRYEKVTGELGTMKARMAELEAKQASTDLPPAGAELLGVAGVQAVQQLVQREIGRQPQTEDRMARIEAHLANQARASFDQTMDDYVLRVGGEPNFTRRIQAGGDISAAWNAYLASPRGRMAQAAFASFDIPTAQMAVDSFMLWQSRETIADAPPTGAEAAVPPSRPPSEADFASAMDRFDSRIRAGESPVKVNAERAQLVARFAHR